MHPAFSNEYSVYYMANEVIELLVIFNLTNMCILQYNWRFYIYNSDLHLDSNILYILLCVVIIVHLS